MVNLQSGGPSYAVELGRLDGLSSSASRVNGKLPQPSFNLNRLNSLFAANGLDQSDMIALSGNTSLNSTNQSQPHMIFSREVSLTGHCVPCELMDLILFTSYIIWH